MAETQSKSSATRLGRALVNEGLLTQNQLRYALQVQHDTLHKKRLGEILLELGYITKRQLREVARKYSHRVPIGSVLVESAVIEQEQLDRALEIQKLSRQHLCEILLAEKIISEEQLATALSRQLDFPYIIPNKRLIDRSLLKLLPRPFMRQHSVLPLSRDNDVTTVLMHNPLDEDALRILDQALNGKYEISVAPKGQVDRVLRELLEEQDLLGQPQATGDTEVSSGSLRRYDLQKAKPDSGPESQVTNVVDYLLANAIQQRASDIHIESMFNRLRVRHRIDGKLVFETDLPAHLGERIVRRIKVLAGIDIAETSESFDGHIYVTLDGNSIDMRVSFFPTVQGNSITIRALTRDIGLKDLGDIGMLPRGNLILKQVLDAPAGMIIFSGPTGAGKTTSMYACLNYLNTGAVKICTVESPVEFSIEGITQCQVKNLDEKQMGDKIRAMMRQDPDVIVLGEVNDTPTAQAAVDAALTGHKVLTTIHAEDSFGAIMRLLDMGLRTYMFSSTGLTVLSQRLIRQICGACKEPHTPQRKLFKQFRLKETDPDTLQFFRGTGCERCGQMGFLGRTGVFEMLAIDGAIRDAILENPSAAHVRAVAEKAGRFISLREAGFIMALKGMTTLEEVLGILSFSEQEAFSEMGLSKSGIEYWTTCGDDEE